MRLRALVLVFTALWLHSPRTEAALGTHLGYTSRAVSLGGAMVASGKDSASAYQNPGSLSSKSQNASRLEVHWSLIYLNPEFEPIDSVTVENDYTSDVATPRMDRVDTEYPATFGQSLGLSYQFQKSPLNMGFGFVTFLPLENLALIDSGETYVPEYTLHRSRNQKPEFDFAVSLRPSERWSLGAGLHLGTTLNSNTTVFLQNDNSKVSTMRVSAGLKTRASPYLGTDIQMSERWRLGLVARLPLKQKARIQVNASGRAIDGIAALDFNYEALAAMFYDPFTLEIGSSLALGPTTLYAQLDYQAWSNFEAPQIVIQNPSTTNCDTCGTGVNFAGSKTPVYPLRDILIPRIGVEHALSDRWQLRAGYSYKPGIYPEAPTGAGNALDPDEHRLGAGFGRAFSRFLEFDTPCRLDFHGSFHFLNDQKVTKSSGDESGAGTGSKIGAPGYTAGGFLWGGGLSLAVTL